MYRFFNAAAVRAKKVAPKAAIIGCCSGGLFGAELGGSMDIVPKRYGGDPERNFALEGLIGGAVVGAVAGAAPAAILVGLVALMK